MKIEYGAMADEYAKYRHTDSAAVERLVVGGGAGRGSRVLEIGCGTGNYISEIQKRTGCEGTGVDPAPELIAEARHPNSRIAYYAGRAERLPLADGAFDLAFSVDVIHHVADRAAYFREAWRGLSVDGLLATLTDSEDTVRGRMPLAFYFPETIEHELRRYPTLAELRQHAEHAGLEVVGEEVVETRYELTDLGAIRRKAFSCLRLISEGAFVAGLAGLARDLERGPIPCVSRNYIMWNRKRAGALAEPHDATGAVSIRTAGGAGLARLMLWSGGAGASVPPASGEAPGLEHSFTSPVTFCV